MVVKPYKQLFGLLGPNWLEEIQELVEKQSELSTGTMTKCGKPREIMFHLVSLLKSAKI